MLRRCWAAVLSFATAVVSLIPEKACADGYTWVRLQGELEYAVEMWGGKTYADFEATLLETDDAKVKLDVLAAAPALRFHIPVYLDVYYDAAEVEPGRIMTVWVRGSTFDDGKVVYSFLGGAELGIELDAPRYATVGWGVDVGWDIEGKGKPPMLADPSLSADDIVNTPLSLGFYGFSAGGIDLRLTQTVYDGHIDTGMTVVNGQLIDAMGEPLTRRDFIFNDPSLWRKVRLEVSPFLNPGELLQLSFEGFAYTLLMKGVYSALGSVLGWEIFEQPVYTIYVVPIPVGDEHFDLSIPIGFPDPDLLPGDFSYSGFPQALDPQSYNQIVGRVRNASSGGTGTPFKVRMSVRQQGSTTWALTHEETIPALAGRDETYVTLPIPAGSLQPGAHEVAIGVDTDNSVVEATEGNNQRVEAFGMLDRLPNLHVRRDSFTQSPEEARRMKPSPSAAPCLPTQTPPTPAGPSPWSSKRSWPRGSGKCSGGTRWPRSTRDRRPTSPLSSRRGPCRPGPPTCVPWPTWTTWSPRWRIATIPGWGWSSYAPRWPTSSSPRRTWSSRPPRPIRATMSSSC